jgi:hypothetical protein
MHRIRGQGDDVPETRLSILVDTLGKALDTEMGREKTRVKVLAVRVHVQLQTRDRICVIVVLNSPKKDTAPSSIHEVIVHFWLEAEIQEICLREVKDIILICPLGGLDRNNWIKTGDCQFENSPKVVIAIIGFTPHGSQGSIDMRQEATQDEVRKEVHKCPAGISISTSTETRDAQAFITIFQHDCVERHDGE